MQRAEFAERQVQDSMHDSAVELCLLYSWRIGSRQRAHAAKLRTEGRERNVQMLMRKSGKLSIMLCVWQQARRHVTDQRGEGMQVQVGKEVGTGACGGSTVEGCSMSCAGLIPSLLPLQALVHQQHHLQHRACATLETSCMGTLLRTKLSQEFKNASLSDVQRL